MKQSQLLLCSLLFATQVLQAQAGKWSISQMGLPRYQYTGILPVVAVDKDGKDAMLPDDPYFLLGNYKMTLFTHASGIYQLMTGERAWARLNASKQLNYGWNDASLVINGKKRNNKILLTGLQSIAADTGKVQKIFGAGTARYQYQLQDGITLQRTISVKPSEKINTGNPSFVVTVEVTNKGKKLQSFTYNERMLVNYVVVGTQFNDPLQRPLLYHAAMRPAANQSFVLADLFYEQNKFLHLPGKNERYVYDLAPPPVFMYAGNKTAGIDRSSVIADKDTLIAATTFTVKPNETIQFHVVIGWLDKQHFAGVQQQVDDVLNNASVDNTVEGLFAKQWKKKLPDFSSEQDEVIKREMLWNAHMVEASATYNNYYKETFIPQGTVYAYHFGDNISNRDHLQAALPACYTNPPLAKSSIRYVIAHSEADGEIKRGNAGFGYTPSSLYKESDEQLFFFNTIAEYLLITSDYDFLNEQVAYYPAGEGKKDAVLNILKKYFIFLRDDVGTGLAGLVKILHSDWSDSFFHEYTPDKYSHNAVSHLNSVMVLAIFPKLEAALKNANNPEATAFINALEDYRSNIEKAYMQDFGDRKFSARAYLSNQLKFGLETVCLEPQGYLLQIPTLPNKRRQEIYDYVKSTNFTPEQIGFRIREKPLWKGKPDGEDGAIWYSLEYPVLLGVATFDKAEAWRMLKAFSFDSYAKKYPQYWVGQWTAPDDLNSTLSTRAGLYSFWEPDIRRAFQGYCSHPHTWPLFCYFKLMETK